MGEPEPDALEAMQDQIAEHLAATDQTPEGVLESLYKDRTAETEQAEAFDYGALAEYFGATSYTVRPLPPEVEAREHPELGTGPSVPPLTWDF